MLVEESESYCSKRNAARYAGIALKRARKYTCKTYETDPEYITQRKMLMGLSSVSAIKSLPGRKSSQKSYICSWTLSDIEHYYIDLSSIKTRFKQEKILCNIQANIIARKAGLDEKLHLEKEISDSLITSKVCINLKEEIDKVLKRKQSYFALSEEGSLEMISSEVDKKKHRVILSGSFNPFHYGHQNLLITSCAMLELPGIFEFSVTNADKKNKVTTDVALDRTSQFAGECAVIVSNLPTFQQKVQNFPNSVFVVGYDTAIRILDKKFYNNKEENIIEFLQEVDSQNCSFLIATRDNLNLPNLSNKIPGEYRHLFESLPESKFPDTPISSTSLRSQN
eukprot:TRINITY_DN1247_c0_g1_i3.p1 TRINITY_DN1247_c0_g1~~TRINITY_DN1247_c0_g1_i3.p1  ORF type:complete len:338 (+),score=47.38 TRINITY_DN1247_c0_g1_i3:367-1380(+)